jgi:hypothetical protein
MSEKVSVARLKGGAWAVTREKAGQAQTDIYKSKVEAVTNARSISSSNNLVIHTAAGQVLRTINVKTSRPKNIMRDAVLSVVQKRAKKS